MVDSSRRATTVRLANAPMFLTMLLTVFLTVAWPARPAAAQGSKPRIEFELVTMPGFSITRSRKWLDTLKSIPRASVRIRGGRSGDRPEIKAIGSPPSAYKVTGLLTRGNSLIVVGGEFGISDSARLKRWAEKLATSGPEGLSGGKTPFGLRKDELIKLHSSLAVKVTKSTKGQKPTAVVDQITRSLALRTDVTLASRRALAEADPVADELQGLTAGTALAAAIRPAGLVLTVTREGRDLQLHIVDFRESKEAWLVGWPNEKPLKDSAPELFKFLDVEITDVPLQKAIDAIQPRLKMPVLIDLNSAAALDIDPATFKVTVPPGRTYYKRILDKALFQAKMKVEIRMDEADRVFLWLTAIRPPKQIGR